MRYFEVSLFHFEEPVQRELGGFSMSAETFHYLIDWKKSE